MEEEIIHHIYTDEITCPHCGLEFTDSWEQADRDDHTCDHCGGLFTHQRDIEITYITRKIEPKDIC
jgi:hypothetical protein